MQLQNPFVGLKKGKKKKKQKEKQKKETKRKKIKEKKERRKTISFLALILNTTSNIQLTFQIISHFSSLFFYISYNILSFQVPCIPTTPI